MILKQIANIVQTYMGLPNGVVWIMNEKANLPKTESFTINVGFLGMKGLGSTNTFSVDSEEITTNMAASVYIDIYGKSYDVMLRQAEIVQAMNSTYAKEKQISEAFLIGTLPTSMNNLSGLDGAAIPYRFQIVFNVQFLVKKTNKTDYYDNYSGIEIKENS